MKKIKKIHINSSIFVSANVLILMFQMKSVNATPTTSYGKIATKALLAEVIRNPNGAFIKKLPNGKLKGHFLPSGQRTTVLHNFIIKSGSIVGEKTSDGSFKTLLHKGNQRRLVSESTEFKILTFSKHNLRKEINIFQEGENIIVTSEKGKGTPKHVFKNTILDFGNGETAGPSTSAQASVPSSKPTITVTRHSISNGRSTQFDTETIAKYEAQNLKLISNITKTKSLYKLETVTQHEDGTNSKVIEHSDGRKDSFVYNHLGETLFSNVMESDGSRIITTRLNTTTYSKLKYGSTTKKLIEKTKISPTQLESKFFDDDGNLTSTTKVNKTPTGETTETKNLLNGYTTIEEKRQDGSLSSIITHTPSGESFKQDFDANNTPLNSPYKIN